MDNRHTSSTIFQTKTQIEEDKNIFDRSQRPSNISSIITEKFYSNDRSIKPLGRSAVAITIEENRQREKRELTHLNDRFASYIERVRFLEAQNRKYQLEIDHLRQKWGSETTKVKETYENQISKARQLLNDTATDCAAIKFRAQRKEEETQKLAEKCRLLIAGRESDQNKIEFLQNQLLDNEADLNLFRRRIIDLEDEQKRYYIESKKLTSDIQRITKNLDDEILTRIKLENQKENLQKEILFLKDIHTHEIEEIKQLNLKDTTLDPTKFFKHELSIAVTNIRKDYEQLNCQQRTELESWYRLKVTQAIKEVQNLQALDKPKQLREQEEIQRLRTLAANSQQDITNISQRNQELENRIRQLEELIQNQREENIRIADERDQKIKKLRIRLQDLEQNYDELISTKSSLDTEIALYRKLLEGEEQRDGLKQIVANVEEQNRAHVSNIKNDSTTQSRSFEIINESQKQQVQSSIDNKISSHSEKHHSTSIDQNIQGLNRKNLTLTSYVPSEDLFSNRKESTIFEHVYGSRRRRPTTVRLNVQWVPAIHTTSIYNSSGNDLTNRNFKRKTFFETFAIRENEQPKATSPPNFKYTDAYLAAFAPKLIPTSRNIRRLTTPVFAHVEPISLERIRTHSAIDHESIRTRSTRSNNIQKSNSFNRIQPFSSYINSTPPPNLTSYIPNKYEDFSRTQTSSTETIIQRTQRESSSDYSTTNQSEASYKNIDESLPIYLPRPSTSLSPSPTKSTYKPSVPFQSVPTSFSNDIYQTTPTHKETVLPSPNTETRIDKPETLLFSHDDNDDMYSSSNEKSSSITSPITESSTINIESKSYPDSISIAASKPIEILENTLNKYDVLINQISDLLASVSPLSSTVSSMSPGQSILDYELTADGSPILRHKRLERQSSQQSTTSVTNMSASRGAKAKYLIRDDSYDKIVTAIADLDSELSPPSDIETSTNEDEDNDELLKATLPSLSNANYEISETLLNDDMQQISMNTQNEDEHSYTSISSLNESKTEDDPIVDTQTSNEPNFKFIPVETNLPLNVTDHEYLHRDTEDFYRNTILNTNNQEDIIETNNEDDTDLSYPRVTELENPLEPSSILIEKRCVSLGLSQSMEQQTISVLDIENPQYIDALSKESREIVMEPIIKPRESVETSLSLGDSVDPQSFSLDLTNSRLTPVEHAPNLISSSDNYLTVDIDRNEQTVAILNTMNQENVYHQQLEEIESNKIDNISKTSMKNLTLTSSQIIISSPIPTISNSIRIRYISSDVYHGYQGEHMQFVEIPSKTNKENVSNSCFSSSEQITSSSIRPSIETTRCEDDSYMEIVSTLLPSINQDDIGEILVSKIESNDSIMQTEQNIQTSQIFEESQIVLKNPGDIGQDTIETSEANQLISITDRIKAMTDLDMKDLANLQSLSTNKNVDDDSKKEMIRKDSSLITSIQEKVPDTNTTSTETILDEVTGDTAFISDRLANEFNAVISSLDLSYEKSIDDIVTEPINAPSSYTGEVVENNDNISRRTEDNEIDIVTSKNNQDAFPMESSSIVMPELSNSELVPNEIKISSCNIAFKQFTPINDQIFNEQQIFTIEKFIDESSASEEKLQIPIDEDITCTISSAQNLSDDVDDELVHHIIQKLLDDTIDKTMPTLDESPLENKSIDSIQPQNDNIIQQLPTKAEYNITSIKTEIDTAPSKQLNDICESSATNTESDSFELIHALRNHSIALTSQSNVNVLEISSSSTASSHVTSSDRYVSYAIHQMGDSSQERLPAISLAADIPIYANFKANNPGQSIIGVNQTIIKEDDSTEFDATENLTSYTDDLLTQKLYKFSRDESIDASSTDNDVDDDEEEEEEEEFDQNDSINNDPIINKTLEPNSSANVNDDAYPCYDLATTPSSNNSSSSSRQQLDDVYLIPGYPGLWRPSTSKFSSNSPREYDADDESRRSESRTGIRTSISNQCPLSFQHHSDHMTNTTSPEILPSHVPVRPDTIDLVDQSLNDLSLNMSESESYQTCQSSISKNHKHQQLQEINQSDEQHQQSPDESIFLIRERERGVSLPVTMKIDCDDIALRLSTSTPIESHLYSNIPYELSSPSVHSEPLLFDRSNSSSQRSISSLNSNEIGQQKTSSWSNTMKTVTTTEDFDEPLKSRVTFLKSSKGPISIIQCDLQGSYIIIENTSQSKHIDLTNWTLRQEDDRENNLFFTLPDNFYLKPKQSLKILTKANQFEQKNDDLVASCILSWHTGPNIVTKLYNADGKDRSTLIKKTIFS